MSVITDKATWKLSTQENRMTRGPLIVVKHPDGHHSKMYQQDAIEAGLVQGKKSAAPAENKMMDAPANKSVAPPKPSAPAEPDDFASIDGIGRATSRRIVAAGITTFEQLKTAGVDFLSAPQRAAIEEWKTRA